MKNKTLLGLLGVFIFLSIWELNSSLAAKSYFPSAINVMLKIVDVLMSDRFITHLMSSLTIALAGIGYAIIIGVVVGVAMGEVMWIRRLLEPLTHSLRGIASLSLFPILIIVFGIGIGSRVFVIFWTAWPPILISSIKSISDADKELVEASQTMGATRMQILTLIKIPLASSRILTGVKIGFGTGWISLIAAEMLVSTSGIGFMIINLTQTFRFEEAYAYVLIASALLFILTALLDIIIKQVDKKIS